MKPFDFSKISEIDTSQLTGLFKQYLKLKLENMDFILFYRVGEFYETYFDDAIILSETCKITLTSRKIKNHNIPMAGVPKSSYLLYIKKLLDNNLKVAVCEEEKVEDNGILKRSVARKYTKGTLLDDEFLSDDQNNYISAILIKNDRIGFSYCDISTGEFFITEGNIEQIRSEISKISPSEILIPGNLPEHLSTSGFTVPEEYYDAFSKLPYTPIGQKCFNLEYIKPNDDNKFILGFMSANAIYKYTYETQKNLTPNLDNYKTYFINSFMFLNKNARFALELTKNMTDDKKFGSLFWVLDETKTPMGRRLLEKYIQEPLYSPDEILNRENAIEEIIKNKNFIREFDEILENINDLMRNSTKISNSTLTKRIFFDIKKSLSALRKFNELSNNFKSDIINIDNKLFLNLDDFYNLIDLNISDNFEDEDFIKVGANAKLDYIRKEISELKNKIKALENDLIKHAGVKNLKIVNHKTMGYLIEIPISKQNLFKDGFITKQVLSSVARLQTPELIELDKKITINCDLESKLQQEIFNNIKEHSKIFYQTLHELSEKIAKFDVILSFAKCAIRYNYIKPKISTNSQYILKDGKHPALFKKNNYFDENSIEFGVSSPNFKLLTGPNMAGKSTLMREIAIISIMYQIGSYVPARYALLPLVNKIFVRFGANDNIIKNDSSFMVEMKEVKEILESSDINSLILLDELGKSTSTKDGIAISRAVSEFIIEHIKAKTIFATHFHELKILKDVFKDEVDLICVNFEKSDGTVKRVLKSGFLDESYGIDVGTMIGLPNEIIEKAKKYLA